MKISDTDINLITYNLILNQAKLLLKEKNIADYSLSAEYILAHLLNIKRTALFKFNNKYLTQKTVDEYLKLIERRANGEPIQYIIGEWDFYGLTFKLNNSVLIPRPETEILVENVINEIGDNEMNGVEIGCGSGAISVSILFNCANCHLTATDISQDCLRVTLGNAMLNGVADRINLIQSDIFENVKCKYDFIITNPPYVKSDYLVSAQSELSYEPKIALDGGDDGLFYIRQILEQSPTYLKDNGFIAMEIGYDQKNDVEKIAQPIFKNYNFINDYNDIPRVFKGRL